MRARLSAVMADILTDTGIDFEMIQHLSPVHDSVTSSSVCVLYQDDLAEMTKALRLKHFSKGHTLSGASHCPKNRTYSKKFH